ncbi:MAG: tetratricopeptide repeat protein, partial [Burkholderiales bacterium]|nr:tetratricopeptide repeat protein [Burkholderiales bacterium]
RLGLLQVIGLVQADRGQYDAALASQRRLIAASETTPGTTMTARFNYRNTLGRTLFQAGRYAEAVAECEAMLPQLLKVFGPGGDTVIKVRQLLVVSLAGLGRYDQALALARENLAARVAGGTNDEESVAITRAPIGDLLVRAGRYDEAAPLLREVVDSLQRHHVERSTHDLEAIRRMLGRALLGQGEIAEGTRVMELARDRLRAIDPDETSPDWGAAFESLAAARRLAGDMAGSEQLLDRACTNLARSPGRASPAFLRCEAQRTWQVARRSTADDGAARAAFATAAQSYALPLDAGHPARADLLAMQAALDHPARPFGAANRGPAILLH